jgi:transcriptional regulator with XRE-family HTH domain
MKDNMLNKSNDIKQNDFPRRFRQLRRQKNLSQAELGKMVGIHYTHIGRYERGLSKPNSETVKRLSEALGVTNDYLIEGETDEVAKARLEDRELLNQFREIEKLPEKDKSVVKIFLDAFISRKKIQALVID